MMPHRIDDARGPRSALRPGPGRGRRSAAGPASSLEDAGDPACRGVERGQSLASLGDPGPRPGDIQRQADQPRDRPPESGGSIQPEDTQVAARRRRRRGRNVGRVGRRSAAARSARLPAPKAHRRQRRRVDLEVCTVGAGRHEERREGPPRGAGDRPWSGSAAPRRATRAARPAGRLGPATCRIGSLVRAGRSVTPTGYRAVGRPRQAGRPVEIGPFGGCPGRPACANISRMASLTLTKRNATRRPRDRACRQADAPHRPRPGRPSPSAPRSPDHPGDGPGPGLRWRPPTRPSGWPARSGRRLLAVSVIDPRTLQLPGGRFRSRVDQERGRLEDGSGRAGHSRATRPRADELPDLGGRPSRVDRRSGPNRRAPT